MKPRARGALACILLLSACPDSDAGELEDAQATPDDAGDGGGDDAAPDDVFSVPPEIPAEWRRVTGECSISLRGVELSAAGNDSGDFCVALFEDPECTYRVEYGSFADPFEHASSPDFSFEDVRIEGDPGRLVTALFRPDSEAYVAGVHVPSFANDPPEYSLSATARCASVEALERARIVLQTVQLPHVGSGLCVPIRPQKCSPI